MKITIDTTGRLEALFAAETVAGVHRGIFRHKVVAWYGGWLRRLLGRQVPMIEVRGSLERVDGFDNFVCIDERRR